MAIKKDKAKEELEKLEIRGKIPPQNIEIEKTVLGAILIDHESIDKIIELITAESFYLDTHRIIYKAILEISNKNQAPIDYLILAEKLKAQNELERIGGFPYLIELTNKVATSAHIEYHARIIQQKYIQRELITAAVNIQEESFDETKDVKVLIEHAEAEIFNVSKNSFKKDARSLQDILQISKNKLEIRKQKFQEFNSSDIKNNAKQLIELFDGLPSGFDEIDAATLGWQEGDLIILAARPSMGKTAFALTLARNLAVEFKKGVVFFSLEMGQEQLATRLLTIETEISGENFRLGKFSSEEWEKVDKALNVLSESPIYIDDTPAISVYELNSKCKRLIKEHQDETGKSNIRCIIIDYLQLMTTGDDKNKSNREQEISTISRTLKAIAKNLNVPVIALSQLNRSVETRTGRDSKNKEPQLSDLRESGAIEQDADLVAFVHRPEYYGIKSIQMKNRDEGEIDVDTTDLSQIIIAKHRNGETGKFWLKFNKSTTKFANIEIGDPRDVLLRNRIESYEEVSGGMSNEGGYVDVHSKSNSEDNFLQVVSYL